MQKFRFAAIFILVAAVQVGNFPVSRLPGLLPSMQFVQFRFLLTIVCLGIVWAVQRPEPINRSSATLAALVTGLYAYLAFHAALMGTPDFATRYIVDLFHVVLLVWIAVLLLRDEQDMIVASLAFLTYALAVIPIWFAGLKLLGPITFYRIEFAGFMAALYLGLAGRRWFYLALPVLFFCVMASLSKAAVVCAAIATMYAIFLLAVLRQAWVRPALVGAAAVAGLVVFVATSWHDLAVRLDKMEQPPLAAPRLSNMITIHDASQRIQMALLAFDIAKKNIVNGVGIGAYEITVMNSEQDGFDKIRYPHNVSLEVFYSTGLIGVTLFAATVLAYLVALHRQVLDSPPVVAIAAGVVFVFLTSHLSGNLFDFRMFWLLVIPDWRSTRLRDLASAVGKTEPEGRIASSPAQ